MPAHFERHYVNRTGWLRAAVLGANDGIVSTASLIIGVAAASADKPAIVLAGLSGMVAGAMSMAAGEYVSVSSQSDTEYADLQREAEELRTMPEAELAELAAIYERRGLDRELAHRVAVQLSAEDALDAHARDELGITETLAANPVQAALTSALTFALGAALPLAAALLSPLQWVVPVVAIACLASLMGLGALGARAGGADMRRGALRVAFWSAAAMAATALVGHLFGQAMG